MHGLTPNEVDAFVGYNILLIGNFRYDNIYVSICSIEPSVIFYQRAQSVTLEPTGLFGSFLSAPFMALDIFVCPICCWELAVHRSDTGTYGWLKMDLTIAYDVLYW